VFILIAICIQCIVADMGFRDSAIPPQDVDNTKNNFAANQS